MGKWKQKQKWKHFLSLAKKTKKVEFVYVRQRRLKPIY